jgi:hypothetical protein
MCSLPRRNCDIDTFAVRCSARTKKVYSSLEMLQKVQNGSIARRNSKFAKTIVLVNEKLLYCSKIMHDLTRPQALSNSLWYLGIWPQGFIVQIVWEKWRRSKESKV